MYVTWYIRVCVCMGKCASQHAYAWEKDSGDIYQNISSVFFLPYAFLYFFKCAAVPTYDFISGKKVLENQPQFFSCNMSAIFIFFFTSLSVYKNLTQMSALAPLFSDSKPQQCLNCSYNFWQFLCSAAPWPCSASWPYVCTYYFYLSLHQSEHKVQPLSLIPSQASHHKLCMR